MRKPSTGEPYAGKPLVRFGGRGEPKLFPTPIIVLPNEVVDPPDIASLNRGMTNLGQINPAML